MMFSTRRPGDAPRRTMALIVLSFAVYFAACICSALATERLGPYTGRSRGADALLAATFGSSSTYVIISEPLAWATRICWAASIVVMFLAVVVHVHYYRRLPPDQQAAMLQRARRR